MAVQRNTSGARTARGAGTGANGPSGGPSQNNRSGKPRKRRISKKQQAIYRRRRIVAGTVLLLIIALIVFCVYSLGRGIGAVNSMIQWKWSIPCRRRYFIITSMSRCITTGVTCSICHAGNVNVTAYGVPSTLSKSIRWRYWLFLLATAAVQPRFAFLSSGFWRFPAMG